MHWNKIRALLAACALLLAGCGGESAEQLIASAKKYAAQGAHSSAVIELKNALQKEPANGEARLLLGEMLLQVGDPIGAEIELRKVQAQGHARERVTPLLARALFERGDGAKAIEEFAAVRLETPQADADLRAALGRAYLAQGKSAQAREAFDAALAAAPGHTGATLGLALLRAADQDLPGALQLVEQALQRTPQDIDALRLKAEILVSQGKADEALAGYRRLLEVRPRDVWARVNLVTLLIDRGDLQAAGVEVDALKKTAPKDNRTAYVQALLLARQGKFAEAREPLQQVLKSVPEHVPSLVLAGLIEQRTGAPIQAQQHLLKALALNPRQTYARRLLVASYMQARQPQRALEALAPLLQQAGEDDAATLLLAGEVYLANNELQKAARYFERAGSVGAASARARARLSQIRMAQGDVERAMRDLEAISADDPKSVEADLVLIGVHLRRGELDRALSAVDRLEAKQPVSPVSHNFRGAIYAAKRDHEQARASFERALQVLPGYYPALSNLARLDLMEKKPEAARKRFEAALQKDANNEQLLLGLAGVLAAARAPRDEIRTALERAVSANPSSPTARAALIDFHLRGRDINAALAAAQAAQSALPEDPRVAEMLGVAQLAAGENQQAVATFGKLASLQPDSARLQLRLAAAYAAAKEQAAAMGALRKALDLDPNLPGVRQQLAALLVEGGDPSVALAEARATQRKAPFEPVGFALEGAVFAAQNKWPEAERAYRQALAKRATPGAVIDLAIALDRQGKQAQADALTRDWIERNGRDVAVRMYLAERALLKQDYVGAARLYRTLHEIRPDDPVLLNNLAWAAGNTNDPEALRYAEQAYALAPQNPAVLDTYGMLLTARGEPARGVEMLRAAVALAPELHVLRLNLAKALSDTGARQESREEAQRVIAQSNSEPLKAQARALLEKR